MKRCQFVTLLGGGPLSARAQQPAHRIGMLIGY
jgi:hypothetical protein